MLKKKGEKIGKHGLENDLKLVERNRLNLYSVQQRSTADQNAEWYKLFQHSTILDILFNISWVHLLLNKMLSHVSLA